MWNHQSRPYGPGAGRGGAGPSAPMGRKQGARVRTRVGGWGARKQRSEFWAWRVGPWKASRQGEVVWQLPAAKVSEPGSNLGACCGL